MKYDFKSFLSCLNVIYWHGWAGLRVNTSLAPSTSSVNSAPRMCRHCFGSGNLFRHQYFGALHFVLLCTTQTWLLFPMLHTRKLQGKLKPFGVEYMFRSCDKGQAEEGKPIPEELFCHSQKEKLTFRQHLVIRLNTSYCREQTHCHAGGEQGK